MASFRCTVKLQLCANGLQQLTVGIRYGIEAALLCVARGIRGIVCVDMFVGREVIVVSLVPKLAKVTWCASR